MAQLCHQLDCMIGSALQNHLVRVWEEQFPKRKGVVPDRADWVTRVHSQYTMSHDAHSTPVTQTLLSMFYQQGTCGEKERLGNLNKVTQLVGSRAGIPLKSV